MRLEATPGRQEVAGGNAARRARAAKLYSQRGRARRHDLTSDRVSRQMLVQPLGLEAEASAGHRNGSTEESVSKKNAVADIGRVKSCVRPGVAASGAGSTQPEGRGRCWGSWRFAQTRRTGERATSANDRGNR